MRFDKFKKHILAHKEQCNRELQSLTKAMSLRVMTQPEIGLMRIARGSLIDQTNLINDIIRFTEELKSKSMKSAANKRAKTVHKNIRSKSKRK